MTNVVLTANGSYQASIDAPPRLQWEANYGYCGEVSFITAGLRYGHYLSQYDARAIASPGKHQAKEGSQLILGKNAGRAAEEMRLQAEAYDNSDGPNAPAFLTWIKDKIRSNYSVIIGVYMNEYFFDNGDGNPTPGDDEYDHIVHVLGVTSHSPLQVPAEYHPNDTITFSDNGLCTEPLDYIYRYKNDEFQRSRKQANAKHSPPYPLPSAVKNYGIAISGIIDHDGQTLPVHLSTNLNYEKPVMKHDSNTRPTSKEKLTITVTVDNLQVGQQYNLYRYDSFSNVPVSSFNAKRGQAANLWQIQPTGNNSYVLSETIRSDQTVIYRAVPVTAP